MSKVKKKKGKSKGRSIMNRSDIPYAQRMALKHQNDIIMNRNHAAKIAMFCTSVAMYELEGIGYKRLIRFAQHFQVVLDEFYEDPELGMAHAKHRLDQMGMPISGDFFTTERGEMSVREHEIENHALQAVQIALICSAITMNDEFGFGQERQTRINKRVYELSDRYAKEGEKFLLEKMEKIGFVIDDGEVLAFSDDDGNAITPRQWLEQRTKEGNHGT